MAGRIIDSAFQPESGDTGIHSTFGGREAETKATVSTGIKRYRHSQRKEGWRSRCAYTPSQPASSDAGIHSTGTGALPVMDVVVSTGI